MKLSEELLALLGQPSTCYLATVMADGSPQLTQTWVDRTASTSSSTVFRAI